MVTCRARIKGPPFNQYPGYDGFQIDGDNLLGYEEFLTKYKADDPGAFAQETPPETPPATPSITLPGKHDKPSGRKYSLSELMEMKNKNPDMEINLDS